MEEDRRTEEDCRTEEDRINEDCRTEDCRTEEDRRVEDCKTEEDRTTVGRTQSFLISLPAAVCMSTCTPVIEHCEVRSMTC